MTAHVVLVTHNPSAGTSQDLPRRKCFVANRTDKLVLDNFFLICREVNEPVLVNLVSGLTPFEG